MASDYALEEQTVTDFAWALQDAAVDTLDGKSQRVLEKPSPQSCGRNRRGANKNLRLRINEMVEDIGDNAFYMNLDLCTDDGAIIAYAGFLRLKNEPPSARKYTVSLHWQLNSLTPVRIQATGQDDQE